MRKQIKLFFGFFALAALFLIQGCANENWMDNAGQPVVFSAVSSYENGPTTRTSYSGVDNDETISGYTKKYERIDWVENDKIQIYSPQARTPSGSASADYKVVGVTANGKYSEADITNLTEDARGLQWSEGTNDFYALYPSPIEPGLQPAGGSANIVGNNFDVTIPATQTLALQTSSGIYQPNMNTAYMWAAASGQSTQTEPVELAFHPAVTAFQFTIGSPKALTIYSFEMSSSSQSLNGQVTAVINSSTSCTYTCPSRTAANSKISVTFNGTTGISIAAGDSLKFAVFAMPQDLTNMTVKFVTSDGTRSLALNENNVPYVFNATKKYRITNLAIPEGDRWEFKIDQIDNITTYGHYATPSSLPFDVTSYKIKNGDESNKIPVAWKIEYSTDQINWSTSNDGKIGVNLTTGGGGSTLTVNNGANVLRDHYDSEYTGDSPEIVDGATAALRSAPDIPAGAKDTDGYYDLSKHPVYGDNQFGTPQNMETANCYVVQGPGLYKFPLVYGNAIKNGQTNTKSYAPSITSPQGHFLSNFVRHDGSAIAGPWITTDNHITVNDAIIVWQDGTENAAGQIIKDADVSVDGNYIKFEVKRELIRPGNVVIAARNSSGTIVWSWHIWVTEKNLSPKTIMADNGSTTLNMMPYNLGWMDATSARSTKYDNWTMYVRVSQTETGGTSRIFRVRQIGDVIRVDANVGCNTFYQWGRKDPMLPATGESVDKAQYSANNLRWESSKNHKITSGGFEVSIQHPNWQLVNLNGTEAYYCGNYYGNLWDAELDNGYTLAQYFKRLPVKTVYDPCPPGFVVPYAFAFSGVSKNTSNQLGYAYYNNGESNTQLWATYTANIGYRFKIPGSDQMDFPFCGARAHDGDHGGEGSIYDVTSLGYYWTSCPLEFNSEGDHSGVAGKRTAKMMIMNGDLLIRPGHEQRKAAGYAVRPVLE